jgi:hypothetical protein
MSTQPGPSGHGGNGGRGGDGGSGGAGGHISFLSVLPIPASAQINVQCTGGDPGPGGAGGKAGWPDNVNQQVAQAAARLGGIVDGQAFHMAPKAAPPPPPRGFFGASGGFGARGSLGMSTQIAGSGAAPILGNAATNAPFNSFVGALSSDHVAMVVNRLRFQYLTQLTFPSLDVNAKPDQGIASMKNSLDWLNLVVPSATSSAANDWRTARSLLDELTLKVNTQLDYYGNRFDMVPALNPDISELTADIATLKTTEAWYNSLIALVNTSKAQSDDVSHSLASIANTFDQQAADLATQLAELDQLSATDLPAAQRNVLGALDTMNKSFADELKSIQQGMSWSLTSVFSSLGSLAMFAGPEFSLASSAGRAYAAGGALSIASNFDTNRVDAGGSSIDKSYLLSKVRNVQASADGLEQAWDDVKDGFLTPNGNSTMLIGKKEEFDQFLDQYFPSNQQLRGAVDQYMNLVQIQNQLVLKYNKGVANVLQLHANQLATTDAKNLAENALEQLNTPGLMQLSRLAAQAYTSQIRDVLYSLYVAGRAYACLALQASASLAQLGGIDDASQLNSDAITTALTTLEKELSAFDTDLATHLRATTTVALSATATNGAAWMFNAFRATGQVTFFVDPALDTIFDGHDQLSGKADIRVASVRAYLKGSGLTGVPIQMTVRGGGRCAIQPVDANRQPLWFDIPEAVHSNVFQIDAAGTIVDTSHEDVLPTTMVWGKDRTVTASLTGVYSSWSIAVASADVKLDTLSEIQLVFDINYRAFDSN